MKYLHITDYDDTISPRIVDGEIDNRKEHIDHYKDFLNTHKEIGIAYSSGRVVREIKEFIERFDLPKPDYIIGSIGGEIYDYKNHKFLNEWDNHLKTAKNWDNKKVRELITKMGIKLQEEEQHHFYKVCSFLDDADENTLKSIKNVFKEQNIPINLVYSSRMYLDIIPSITNKGKAGVFLANYENISLENVAISGDSLNDVDMFFEDFGIKIAPINAETNLIEKVKNEKNFYHATKKVAFGTVEGLNKFIKSKGNF